MPAFYALAQHDALDAARARLLPGEHILSFLDDLYVVTTKTRAATAFRIVADEVERHAGVRSHLGKLRMWCKGGGEAPPDVAALGPEVWTAANPADTNGLTILGTPLGTQEYINAHADKRLQQEQKLLQQITLLDDPQQAWAMLVTSAVPRANHIARILSPTVSYTYTDAHDMAIWDTFCDVLATTKLKSDGMAHRVATLPGRLGGLGLRSATWSAAGAFWASWVNSLPVIMAKSQPIGDDMVRELQLPTGPPTKILRDLASCKWQLQQHGALHLPTWAEVATGVEPPAPNNDIDAADLDRGWQCHVCSFSEDFYKNNVVLPSCDDARQAMLLSQSGGPASAWLRAIPSQPVFTFTPLCFQVAIRRRLRWPFPLSAGKCSNSCNHTLDDKGDHAASCATSGRIKSRSVPMEKDMETYLAGSWGEGT